MSTVISRKIKGIFHVPIIDFKKCFLSCKSYYQSHGSYLRCVNLEPAKCKTPILMTENKIGNDEYTTHTRLQKTLVEILLKQ